MNLCSQLPPTYSPASALLPTSWPLGACLVRSSPAQRLRAQTAPRKPGLDPAMSLRSSRPRASYCHLCVSVPICSIEDGDRMGLRLCVRLMGPDKVPRAVPVVEKVLNKSLLVQQGVLRPETRSWRCLSSFHAQTVSLALSLALSLTEGLDYLMVCCKDLMQQYT